MKKLLGLLALASSAAFAQTPTITSVVDGGAYTNNVAQGSVIIIKGTNLSAAGYVPAAAPIYPTTLNSVRITFTAVSGGAVTNVLMVYTYNLSSVNQLAGVIPSTTAAGAYDVRVINGANTSAAFRTNVQARKPGIVTADGSGTGEAQATLDGKLILQRTSNKGKIGDFDTRSAHPGERVDLWGTGLGPDTSSDTGGTSGDQTSAGQVRVVVNGTDVTPLYAGRSQGYPGLDQIVFILPANTALSCTVTIQVRAGGVTSNTTTIATSTGDTCPPPSNGGGGGGSTPSQTEISQWINSGNFSYGSINIGRNTSHAVSDFPAGTTTAKTSSFTAVFGRASGLAADLQKFLVPSVGQCTVLSLTAGFYPGVTFQYYDAGPGINGSGPNGAAIATRTITNVTGTTTILYDASTLAANFITAARYTLSGTGGPNVGAFSGTLDVGDEVVFTNWEEAKIINRSSGFTVRWTGASTSQYVSISGVSVSLSGSSTIFTCLANRSAGQFSIPAGILTQLPASGVISGGGFNFVTRGSLSISGTTNGTRINASGVDFLTANDSSSESVTTQWN